MLALRKVGVSYPKIGAYFGIDFSTARYHVISPDRPIQKRWTKGQRQGFPIKVPDTKSIAEPIIKEALAMAADPNYVPTLTDTRNLGGLPRKGTGSGNWKRPKDIIPKVIYVSKPGKNYADYLKEQKEFARNDDPRKSAIIKISEPKKTPKFNKFLGEWS